jgi:hypothetical protein
VVLRARDAQKLVQAKRAVEDMLECSEHRGRNRISLTDIGATTAPVAVITNPTHRLVARVRVGQDQKLNSSTQVESIGQIVLPTADHAGNGCS